MGKQNNRQRTSTAKQSRRTNRQQRRRASNRRRTNTNRGAGRGGLVAVPYGPAPTPRIPIPVPWMVLAGDDRPDSDRAADGSTTIRLQADDAEDSCYAVFNAEGLLTEFIQLLGTPAPGEEERLLAMFKLRRQAVGDPAACTLWPQDDQLQLPLGDQVQRSACELVRHTYQTYELADDGSRTVLAEDESGHKWLLAIDEDGVRYDGVWVDLAHRAPAYVQELQRFAAARRAVGDPMFTRDAVAGGVS